jgi:hypothetical protein
VLHKESFALKFLNGLNKDPKYASFVMTTKTNWSQIGKTPDFLELVKQIKLTFAGEVAQSQGGGETALQTQAKWNPGNCPRPTTTRRNVTCHYCHKRGHVKSECWDYARAQGRRNGCKRGPSDSADAQGTFAHAFGVMVALNAETAPNSFLLDSGATQHMVNCSDGLAEVQPVDIPLLCCK